MPIRMSATCQQIYLKNDWRNDNKLPEDADHAKYNYSARHPAHKLLAAHGWNAFYANLQKEISSQKSLKIVSDTACSTPYQLCNYGSDQFQTWNEYTIICRGLVIDNKANRIIASPFPKFFNYAQYHKTVQKYICEQFKPDNNTEIENTENENQEEKQKETSTQCRHGIFEKVDGSLGICFYCEYSKQWRIVTRGHFGSPQAQWAMQYVHDKALAIDTWLQRGHTYLFEIIYKENRIGVDYGDFEGLILLHAYNADGYEYSYEYLQLIASKLQMKIAACYNDKYRTVADLLSAQKHIDKNTEGFVLCLSNGFRVKFKGEEYLNMIRKKNYSSTAEMMKGIQAKIVMDGKLEKADVLDEYEDELHDEIGKAFDEVYAQLLQRTQDCVHDLVSTNNLSKNQLSVCVQHNLHYDVSFIAKARKVCNQNLWKSYMGKKSNKKLMGKAVNRITNEVIGNQEWRLFIMNSKSKSRKK